MHMMIVKAIADGSGPDITGRIVPMPAGSYHLCREDDRSWFEQRSDVFSFVTQRDDKLAPSLFALDDDGNVTWLVGPDGAGVLRGPMVSGLWFTSPSVFRLRMTGTGSVQFDSRNSAGTVTAVATYTLTGATDQIEFPYAGDNAVAIRATFSGDITVEVI